ncbi:MAG TPA: hypothetical protein P5056_01440 [Candidatus Paceibacterota bacterium]|nr:hypothetical protein [Candidatus Paceibacterota bacterium]
MENMEQQNQKSREWRIVGKASLGKKNEFKEKMNKKLFAQTEAMEKELKQEQKDEVKAAEIEKTAEQIRLIELANEDTNKLMERLGFEPIDISPDNVYVIKSESFSKLKGPTVNAFANYNNQAIVINGEKPRLVQGGGAIFCTLTFHEMLHLKSHISFEAQSDKRKPELFRAGVTVYSSVKSDKEGMMHGHFRGLNEAIVALAEQDELKNILGTDEFKEEGSWQDSVLAKDVKEDIPSIKDKDAIFVLRKKIEGQVPKTLFVSETLSYTKHKETLKYLMQEILWDNQDNFISEDEVFDVFLRAHFSGGLLEIAKLVERSFGEGSFRQLGEMTDSASSAVSTLELFKKLRGKILREREKGQK